MFVVVGPDILKKLGQGEPGSVGLSISSPQDLDPSNSPSPHHRQRSVLGKHPSNHNIPNMGGHHPPGGSRATSPALVSYPLDCALVGSSSHIGDRLQKYGAEHDRRMTSRDTSLDRHQPKPREHEEYYHNHNSVPQHNRLPHSSTNSIRRLNRQERVPETLSPTGDNYSYTGSQRDDSGLGRELDSPLDYRPHNSHQHHQHPPSTTLDRSPDSGMSDSDDPRYRPRPLQRRKTLPSIVKRVPGPTELPNAQPVKKTTANSIAKVPTSAEPETYVIENGIRKRVRAEVHGQTSRPKNIGSDETQRLPNRYKMEPSSKGSNRGSLPDVSICKELEKKLMPREEASRLSHQRRAELSLLQQEAERRRQQEIVLRFADLKVRRLSLTIIYIKIIVKQLCYDSKNTSSTKEIFLQDFLDILKRSLQNL